MLQSLCLSVCSFKFLTFKCPLWPFLRVPELLTKADAGRECSNLSIGKQAEGDMGALAPGDTGVPLIPLCTASGHWRHRLSFSGGGWRAAWHGTWRSARHACPLLEVGQPGGGRWKVYVLGTVMPVTHDLLDPGQVGSAVLLALALKHRAPTGKTLLGAPFHGRPSTFLCPCIKLLLLSRQW